MSKDLEKEYKELMNQEAKDLDIEKLWTRIEASLPEKEKVDSFKGNNIDNNSNAVQNNVVQNNVVRNSAVQNNSGVKEIAQSNVEGNKKRPWYKKPKVYTYFGTLAAASLFGLLILSGAFRTRQESKEFTGNSFAAKEESSTNVHFAAPQENEQSATTDMQDGSDNTFDSAVNADALEEIEECLTEENAEEEFSEEIRGETAAEGPSSTVGNEENVPSRQTLKPTENIENIKGVEYEFAEEIKNLKYEQTHFTIEMIEDGIAYCEATSANSILEVGDKFFLLKCSPDMVEEDKEYEASIGYLLSGSYGKYFVVEEK